MNLYKFLNIKSEKRLKSSDNSILTIHKSEGRLKLRGINKESKKRNQILITQDISSKFRKYTDNRLKTTLSQYKKSTYDILEKREIKTPVTEILSNLTKKENSLIKEKLMQMISYEKKIGLSSDELESKSSLSEEQFHQINQRILCFKYESKPIIKLETKIINELSLSSENLAHFFLEVKNKPLPIKVKFQNINRDLKINLFTSNKIKRPNKNNFSEFLEHLNSRNLYVISGGEKGKKRFSCENIFFSFETNEDGIIKMFFSFGNETCYILNEAEKKHSDKLTVNNSYVGFPFKYLSDVKYFNISKDQNDSLFKSKSSSSSSKKDEKISSERFNFKNNKITNSDIKKSYFNFLLKRRENFKKLDNRLKINLIRKNILLESKMIQQTLKMNKWKIIRLKKDLVNQIKSELGSHLLIAKTWVLISTYSIYSKLIFLNFRNLKNKELFKMNQRIASTKLRLALRKQMNYIGASIQLRSICKIKILMICLNSITYYTIGQEAQKIISGFSEDALIIQVTKEHFYKFLEKVIFIQIKFKESVISEKNKLALLIGLWKKYIIELYNHYKGMKTKRGIIASKKTF